MGEFIWYFIMATVVGTAFLPLILREKCPTCRKRVLKQLNANEVFDLNLPPDETRFVTYFHCPRCEHVARRVRNNPLEVLTASAETSQPAPDAVLS